MSVTEGTAAELEYREYCPVTVGRKNADRVKKTNLYYYITFHWSLPVSFCNKPKVTFMDRSNHRELYIENKCIISHAQDTTAFQPNLFLTTIYWLKFTNKGGPGSSVGIATGYGLDGPGIESRCGRDFQHLSRPALGPAQAPVQWIPALSRE